MSHLCPTTEPTMSRHSTFRTCNRSYVLFGDFREPIHSRYKLATAFGFSGEICDVDYWHFYNLRRCQVCDCDTPDNGHVSSLQHEASIY